MFENKVQKQNAYRLETLVHLWELSPQPMRTSLKTGKDTASSVIALHRQEEGN